MNEIILGACARIVLLLRAREKFSEHGCPGVVTVRKVCRLARDEGEVRRALDTVWKGPDGAPEVLGELRAGNDDLHRFERMLETVEKTS